MRLMAARKGATVRELLPTNVFEHYLSNAKTAKNGTVQRGPNNRGRNKSEAQNSYMTSASGVKKRRVSPFSLVKPPAIILQPVRQFVKNRFQTGLNNEEA